MAGELKKIFGYVSETFFPGWNKKGTWKIMVIPNLAPMGRCDNEKKLILIRSQRQPHISQEQIKLTEEERLIAVLIHEISHAVASGHGDKWQKTMIEKIPIAEKQNQPNVAKALRFEVERYKDTPPVTAASVYERIEEIVMDIPDMKFQDLMKCIGREYGSSVKKFREDYKRAKLVYEKAVGFWKKQKELEQKFLSKREALK